MIGEAEARALRSLVRIHGPAMPAMAVEHDGRRYTWTGDPGDEITVYGHNGGPGWEWAPTGETLPAPERRTVTAFLARIHG